MSRSLMLLQLSNRTFVVKVGCLLSKENLGKSFQTRHRERYFRRFSQVIAVGALQFKEENEVICAASASLEP